MRACNAVQAKDGESDASQPQQQQFDHFMGSDAGAFAYGDYDEDDKEADEVYAKVEEVMDERRRLQREKREKEEYDQFRKENPLIAEQFEDLKRKLADVSEEEWKGIPEIGDYTVKKRRRFETFSVTPDSLLAGALQTATGATQATEQAGTATDLTALGTGRKQMLGVNLDRMADSVSGQTTVDPTGYLTSLNSKKVSSAAELSDIKRARTLMKSMVTSNPKNAQGWIAFARLEEVAGNLKTARTIIAEGTDACPESEDVWLEAARLQTPESARALLARGVQALPHAVRLWMQAARLETDDAAKRLVLRKALERNSSSVRLWKAAVELHDEDEARLLLARAVECCPDQVDLWIALVRLEPDFTQAKKALNKAIKALPTEHILYITAAKLQEAHGDDVGMVHKIVTRAIQRKLPDAGVIIDRETWLREAETCEKAVPPMVATCRAIVEAVIETAVDERERKDTFHRDAEEALRRGSVETARAILAHACAAFPDSERTWRAAAELEKGHGAPESLHACLERAVAACPHSIILWLMRAKEKWLLGDVPAARDVLDAAYKANPSSEEIMLAAFKLEFENREPARARDIARLAMDKLHEPSDRVWMKAAIVARELGDTSDERAILRSGIERHPGAPKLHMMLGQLEVREGDIEAARAAFAAGVKAAKHCTPLWIMLARLEEQAGAVPSARAILQRARLNNPKDVDLWLALVRMELRGGNQHAASVTLNLALQDCAGVPGVGRLWAAYILLAERAQRKAKMADAVRATDNDAAVAAAFGRVFHSDRKYDTARKYLQRATALEPDIGDYWAMWVACEYSAGKKDAVEDVIAAARKADPKHGERWASIAKDPRNAHESFETIMSKVVQDLAAREDWQLGVGS